VIFKDTGEHAVFSVSVFEEFEPMCLRLQRIFRRGRKNELDARRLAGEPDPNDLRGGMAWDDYETLR